MKKILLDLLFGIFIIAFAFYVAYGFAWLAVRADRAEEIRPKPIMIDSITIDCHRCGWQNTTYLYDSTLFIK